MRDLVVFGVVMLSLPLSFRRPFLGLLVFSWLAYMRPQDLCWGFARDMRLSLFVGLVMIAGYFVNEAGKRPFMRRDVRTLSMIALVLLTYASTAIAEVKDEYVVAGLFEFTKIVAVALLTTGLVDSKQRLRVVVWTFALCLGFFGFKAGLIGLLRGGATIFQGPGGMMEDNNDFALALVMAVPMLLYLGTTEKNLLVNKFTWVTAFLTMVTILLTQSRGGFLALCVSLALITWRSGKLIKTSIWVVVGVVLFMAFAPASVTARLSTIDDAATGKEDSSVGARFRAWRIARRMIEDHPVLGVGHKNFRGHYNRYAEELYPGQGFFNHVSHNSYLQMWSETGTIAFAIFMTMMLSVFVTTRTVRRLTRGRPGLAWARQYANMCETTTIGFMVGAFFLNRAHFDLLYHWMSVVSCTLLVTRIELANGEVVSGEVVSTADDPASPGLVVAWRSPVATPTGLPRWERARGAH